MRSKYHITCETKFNIEVPSDMFVANDVPVEGVSSTDFLKGKKRMLVKVLFGSVKTKRKIQD